MNRRGTPSRVDTDGANQTDDIFAQSTQSQASIGNTSAMSLGYPTLPGAQSAPAGSVNPPQVEQTSDQAGRYLHNLFRDHFTFEDVLHLIQRIKELEIEKREARHESNELRDMLKTLNIKIEQEKSKNQMQAALADGHTLQANDASSLSPRVLETSRSVKTRVGLAIYPLTPRASNEGLPPGSQFSGTPATPTTPRTPFPALPTSSGKGSGATPRSRHKRTQTPTQNYYRKMMNGRPLFTLGIERQDDRGLITDFFDAISVWAKEWTQNSRLFAPDEISKLIAPNSIVCEFLGNTSGVAVLIADGYLRCELVAAIVSNDIVYNTMCDTFLFDSLPQGEDAKVKQLVIEYSKLRAGDEVKKHQLLLEQKGIYTEIKEQAKHRQWRAGKAKQFGNAVVEKLGVLLCDTPAAAAANAEGTLNRNHVLEELYIKGYRIGFRMRQAAEKWVMNWPVPGNDFNTEAMVNESRYLHGNPMKTLERTAQSPAAYAVRFAKSPTITKFDFSSGQERYELIHKGLVHLVRKPNAIGSEREFFSPTRAAFGRSTGQGTQRGV